MFWQHIENTINELTGQAFSIDQRHSVGGGSINQAYRIDGGNQSYFVKTNRKQLAYMFEAERMALEMLHQSKTIKVPQPLTSGVCGQQSYFIMQWVSFSGQPGTQLFAQKLAALHQVVNDRFGFDIDNTIGSTPQLNQWSDDWVDFWQKQRLGYQLGLAKQNGYGGMVYDKGMLLMEKAPLFFTNYQPKASLLHGDLWSGNWAADEQGQPLIFDPASYYGDHEAELAMMELFGHPGRAFFDAYHEVFEIDEDYSMRKPFYNLYHILNHANLFGSSYARQAKSMIEQLLSCV